MASATARLGENPCTFQCWRESYSSSVLTQLQQFLRHLVGGRDDLGVRRVSTLRHDHLGEFIRQVDVGAF